LRLPDVLLRWIIITANRNLIWTVVVALGFISANNTAIHATEAGDEYAQILARYGILHTIAGRGAIDSNGGNDWLEEYEGGPALNAELSEAHNAQADVFGNVYIVDKDSHAIRKVTTDGLIHRVAGINVAGNGTDEAQPGDECALSIPNGLDVHPDGTCYIYDPGNHKIRRLDPDGTITTVFTDPGLSFVGRGLWVNPDGSLIYYANGTDVREWTPSGGVRVLADGFSGGLANLTVDPQGRLVVTDRTAHSVYRIEPDGGKTRIAGNGTAIGGGDGQPALETGLEEVRGIAYVPSGGYFLCTHRGSDIWFVDTNGIVHLFISGLRNSDPFGGEGTLASSPGDKLSEVRAINITPGGDLIITHSDQSTIRIVDNTMPSAISPLRLMVENEILVIRWSSTWDGGALARSDALTAPQWIPVQAVAATGTEVDWADPSWLSQSQGYFRFTPAARWPAP